MARPYARKRVLWVHPRPAFPPRDGGAHRLAGVVSGAAAAGYEVLVVLPGPNDEPGIPGVRLLELEPPQGLRRAAGKVFSRHPLRAPRLLASERRRAAAEIEAFGPTLAVVSDVFSWPLASALIPPGVPWAYDAHNVESALFADLAARARGWFDRVTFAVDVRRVRSDELHLVRTADAVLAVSRADADQLSGLADGRRVEVVPSSVSPVAGVRTPATSPVGLFVGTLDYPPNEDAVTELVGRTWPAVRRTLPEARLLVAGRRPRPALRALLEATPWVELHEDAPDLAPLYAAARCVVLPIRSGSGTRLKVYEALANGLPVVGSTVALAGVEVQPGRDALVADTEDDLADAVADVLTDDALARDLGAAGRLVFDDRLAWERAGHPALVTVLDELGGDGSVEPE